MRSAVKTYGLVAFLIPILLVGIRLVNAQEKTHQGFFISVQAGPAFGSINGFTPTGEKLHITGTGSGFDLLIGGAVNQHLIVHGTLSSKMGSGPSINDMDCSECILVDESFMGGGITWYLKNNFLVSASVGAGNFSLSNDKENLAYLFYGSLPEICDEPYTSFETTDGLSIQFKAGKEWWVSPTWALGILLEYGRTMVNQPFDDSSIGPWSSNRFSIRFSATRNGRKNK